MYLRFVQQRSVSGMRAKTGIFEALWDVIESPTSSQVSIDMAEQIIDWFHENMKEPKRFNRTTSKGHYHKETKGLSWFKSSATDHIAKAYEAVQLLKQNEIDIQVIKSEKVGFIVHEDDIQVVAEPFNDTPTGL